MYPIGEIKAVRGWAPAGQTSSEDLIRPPEGYEWLFVGGFMKHYSGVNKNCAWLIWDEVQQITIGLGLTSVPGDGTEHWFDLHNSIEVKFTHKFYPMCEVLGLPADKQVQWQIVVIERVENLELMLREWYSELVKVPIPALEGLRNRMEQYRGGL